jgi:hypothetical protein
MQASRLTRTNVKCTRLLSTAGALFWRRGRIASLAVVLLPDSVPGPGVRDGLCDG